MKTVRQLLFLFATLILSQVASAQLLGNWVLLDPSGGPAVPGATCTTDIHLENGEIVGDIYIDFGDGHGPQEVPDERSTFTMLDRTGLNYMWINARGTVGLTYWNSDLGRFENLVLTGRNAGRVTVLRRA